MIIAVDYDGTLILGDSVRSEFEQTPNLPLIEELIRLRKNGHKLILWTCRDGDWLTEAINYCKGFGLEFDAHNKNIDDGKKYINLSCKVIADIYIDDRNMTIEEFIKKGQFK